MQPMHPGTIPVPGADTASRAAFPEATHRKQSKVHHVNLGYIPLHSAEKADWQGRSATNAVKSVFSHYLSLAFQRGT